MKTGLKLKRAIAVATVLCVLCSMMMPAFAATPTTYENPSISTAGYFTDFSNANNGSPNLYNRGVDMKKNDTSTTATKGTDYTIVGTASDSGTGNENHYIGVGVYGIEDTDYLCFASNARSNAKLTWDAFEGAGNYLVFSYDVFLPDNNTGNSQSLESYIQTNSLTGSLTGNQTIARGPKLFVDSNNVRHFAGYTGSSGERKISSGSYSVNKDTRKATVSNTASTPAGMSVNGRWVNVKNVTKYVDTDETLKISGTSAEAAYTGHYESWVYIDGILMTNSSGTVPLKMKAYMTADEETSMKNRAQVKWFIKARSGIAKGTSGVTDNDMMYIDNVAMYLYSKKSGNDSNAVTTVPTKVNVADGAASVTLSAGNARYNGVATYADAEGYIGNNNDWGGTNAIAHTMKAGILAVRANSSGGSCPTVSTTATLYKNGVNKGTVEGVSVDTATVETDGGIAIKDSSAFTIKGLPTLDEDEYLSVVINAKNIEGTEEPITVTVAPEFAVENWKVEKVNDGAVVKASATLTNNSSAAKGYKLLLAEYTDGVLTNAAISTDAGTEVAIGGSAAPSATLSFKSGSTYRAFLWNGFGTLVPYIGSAELAQ